MIALVITIIILLILAGISIATLTGENGLLSKANTAKEETEKAEIIERAQTDILGKQATNNGEITKVDVNNIIAQYDKEKKIREDKDEAYIVTEKEYEIKVSDIWNGKTLEGGTFVKDVLKIDSTATEAKDKSPYVEYNGLKCRVLYNDDTHGIQIITAENVEENVTLGSGDSMVTTVDFTYSGSATVNEDFKKAATSYNNLVDNLNNKAKTYMDTKGIGIDARCLGSIPTLTNDAKFQSDTSGMWSYNDTLLNSWNNKFKEGDMNYSEDVKQLDNLGLNVSSEYTWLASRFVRYIPSVEAFLCIRCLRLFEWCHVVSYKL